MAHQLSRMKPTTLRKTTAPPTPIKSPANGDSSPNTMMPNAGSDAAISQARLRFCDIMEQPPPELAVFPSYQCVIVGRRRMQVTSLQVIEVAA
jgi:hypothetical protein